MATCWSPWQGTFTGGWLERCLRPGTGIRGCTSGSGKRSVPTTTSAPTRRPSGCIHCGDIHECGNEEEEEERQYQKDQQAFSKKDAAHGQPVGSTRVVETTTPSPHQDLNLPPTPMLNRDPLWGPAHSCKSQWSTLRLKNILSIIARVDRVAPALARSACRPLGIDLAGEGASRCDCDGLATLV